MSVYSNTSDFPFPDGIFTTEPWQLAVASLLVVLFTSLASAAGIGGGGLVVPVLTYVLGTGVYYASPLSTATILGVSIGKNAVSIPRRHPDLVRPLINYDLATYVQITVLLGTILGVVLHGILPEIIATIILALVLGYSAVEAFKKGVKMTRLEAAQRHSEMPHAAEGLDDPTALETMRTSPRNDDAVRGFYHAPDAAGAVIELTTLSATPGTSSQDASPTGTPKSAKREEGDVAGERAGSGAAAPADVVVGVALGHDVEPAGGSASGGDGSGGNGGEGAEVVVTVRPHHTEESKRGSDAELVPIAESGGGSAGSDDEGEEETAAGDVADELRTPPRNTRGRRHRRSSGSDGGGSNDDDDDADSVPIVTPSSVVRHTHDHTATPKEQAAQLVRFQMQFKPWPGSGKKKKKKTTKKGSDQKRRRKKHGTGEHEEADSSDGGHHHHHHRHGHHHHHHHGGGGGEGHNRQHHRRHSHDGDTSPRNAKAEEEEAEEEGVVETVVGEQQQQEEQEQPDGHASDDAAGKLEEAGGAARDSDGGDDGSSSSSSDPGPPSASSSHGSGLRALASPNKQKRAAIARKVLALFHHDRRCFWWESWVTLGAVTAFMLVYSLVKSEVIFVWATCDTAWWIWYVVPVVVLPLVQYAYSLNLAKWQNKRNDCHYDFQKYEIQFTIAKQRIISLAGLGAGTVASLVGVGGGMVIGPLLLKLKMLPSESSATSGFMMIFTALSGTIQYVSNGSLRWDFLLWFLVAGCGGGLLGELVVKHQVDKLGRPSIIVLLLASVISVATITAVVSGTISIASANATQLWVFDVDICPEAAGAGSVGDNATTVPAAAWTTARRL